MRDVLGVWTCSWSRRMILTIDPALHYQSSVMASGVRVRDTSVVTCSPTWRPMFAWAPTSATVPVSMPPKPVTGLCVLPRVRTMSSTSARTPSPSSLCLSKSWRNDTSSRLSRVTSIRTSSGASSGLVSSRSATCGRTPAGLITRCSPVGSLTQVTSQNLRNYAPGHRKNSGAAWLAPHTLPFSGMTTSYDTNKRRSSSRPQSQQREERMTEQVTVDQGLEQPYPYKRVELVEPDWTRFPGWKDVTAENWASVQWQRSHCVKNIKQLRALMGDLIEDRFYDDLEQDQQQRATMSMLVPPQMMNTMVPHATPTTDGLYADPIRRYMLPVLSDRRSDWPSHPYATRDSLHEHDMWVAEGLTHRYPTKVLAEMLPTCPQYCGHCTRMDLVGNSTPVVDKLKFNLKPVDRIDAMLDYLRSNPGVRDVVVSGGDVANMPWARLESFVDQVLDVDNIRDIRLASKALVGLPQHWLQDEVRAGMERLATKAREREASIAIHTHVNHANSVTPMVAKATRAMLDTGIRDVRNQGVLMGGINDDAHTLLDLCFALLDGAQIMPYYFYMCDMIPFSEHWRVSVARAQELQHEIMGYLPGFATPRIVCDVPFVGKRWVHKLESYDRDHGISHWTKNYRTSIERTVADALTRTYEYYDPIHTLPQAGQDWWREHAGDVLPVAEEAADSQKSLPLT